MLETTQEQIAFALKYGYPKEVYNSPQVVALYHYSEWKYQTKEKVTSYATEADKKFAEEFRKKFPYDECFDNLTDMKHFLNLAYFYEDVEKAKPHFREKIPQKFMDWVNQYNGNWDDITCCRDTLFNHVTFNRLADGGELYDWAIKTYDEYLDGKYPIITNKKALYNYGMRLKMRFEKIYHKTLTQAQKDLYFKFIVGGNLRIDWIQFNIYKEYFDNRERSRRERGWKPNKQWYE